MTKILKQKSSSLRLKQQIQIERYQYLNFLYLLSILKSFNPKNENSYLLTGLEDKFIEPRQAQNIFNKCLSDCKIDKINFHALRHSFATRCIELGMDYKTLSEILGHANVSTTMNLYVHSSLTQKKKQMNKLNNLVNI